MLTATNKMALAAGFAYVTTAGCAGQTMAAVPPALAYTITDLGALPGDVYSEAVSINNAGQVVGLSGMSTIFAPAKIRPWLYSDGKIAALGLLPGFTEGYPTSINNQGLITGVFESKAKTGPIDPRHPPSEGDNANTSFTCWKGTMRAIAIPRPYIGIVAKKSNDRNQIVGSAQGKQGSRPILIEGQRVRRLPMPRGYKVGTAMAINNHGVIVASTSRTQDDSSRSYTIMNGKVQFLGSKESQANDINDRDEIVGCVDVAWNANHLVPITHAFIWDKRHGMRDIGSLGYTAEALAINNLSQVVGKSQLSTADKEKPATNLSDPLEYMNPHAFLWQNGRMYDLNDLIAPKSSTWKLECATAINDHGVIVGDGSIGGEIHTFMLTPVKTVAQSGQTP